MTTQPPTISDSAAGQRKYLKRFYSWAIKLPEHDMRELVKFCQAVQAAWVKGKADEKAAAAAPTEPVSEPKLLLPGLGGGSFIAHQKSPGGLDYKDLDALMPKGGKPRDPAN